MQGYAPSGSPPPYDPAWAPDAGRDAEDDDDALSDDEVIWVTQPSAPPMPRPRTPPFPTEPHPDDTHERRRSLEMAMQPLQETVITVQPRSGSGPVECPVCDRLAAGESIPWDDDDPFGDRQVPLQDPRRVSVVYTVDGEAISASRFVNLENHIPDRPPRAARRNTRICISIGAHIGIWIDIGFLVWVLLAHKSRMRDDPDYHYEADFVMPLGLGATLGALAYMFILIEGFMSTINTFFFNIRRREDLHQYIHTLRHSAPRLILKVKACEWQTYRGVTSKVVVHTEKRQLVLTRCVDISPEIDVSDWGESNFVKLMMRAVVCFEDQETMDRYQHLRHNAEVMCHREMEGQSEVFYEFEQVVKIPGFKQYTMFRWNKGLLPDCIFPFCHVLTLLCMCTCPFRLCFMGQTERQHHVIVKLVGL